jgi:tetratricopeptide (TPR) repeat protein
MRQLVLNLALVLPIAASAWAQGVSGGSAPNQIPGLQLIPPPGLGAGPPNPQATPPGPRSQNQVARPTRPSPKARETDDQLLAKLAKAGDQRAARPIERELTARWAHSGSPSADLLLKRTDQAMEAQDFDTARQIAQKLTDIAPDFAEAWHRRATLAAENDDYEDAITSLRRTLSLQPKNFVALTELGGILEEYNDKPHALEAYRQAKAIDPFIDGIADRIRDLAKSVEGQGI